MRLNTNSNLGISLNEQAPLTVFLSIYFFKLYFPGKGPTLANAYKINFLTRATMC